MNETIHKSANLFQGKHYLVLGLAKSGSAVAKVLVQRGARVTVNERNQREKANGVRELEQMGVRVICGGHPLELLEEKVEMIIKNPGIPYDIPFLIEAQKRQIPIVTEVEIAYLISKAPMIGITGSNGKTTTTTLIYEMLLKSRTNPLIAGNIGAVLCEVADQATEEDMIVAELSSFQLLGTRAFQPQISVLLNIFDTHLDFHHTKEHYIGAKAKLFANQTREQIAILNYDLELTRSLATTIDSQIAWFSFKTEIPRGAFIREQKIIFRGADGEEVQVLPIDQLRLLGNHNTENALAAVTAALEAGASIAQVRSVLRHFKGVAHRLQLIREQDGVYYYNDSKATNAMATYKSLQAFEGSVILIAGGLDRGETFWELKDIFSTHIKALITYGQIADKISKVARKAGVKTVIHVDNVKEAVCSVQSITNRGDTVLLSPAAASWDQFNSFEERGDMFTESVHMLR